MDFAQTAHFESSPADRVHELAGIFATAFQRLHSRPLPSAQISPGLSESTAECLELFTANRLTVPRG